ncbi:MAG: hypothetical protein RML12_09540 [Xanthomonadales bacterium]|nr:hypothetical protein [Xanthomonadales bacterium]
MQRRLAVVLLVLAVAGFLYSLVLLGGLARHPSLGPPVLAAAEREAPLLALHLRLGARLAEAGIAAESGLAAAKEIFAPIERELLEFPATALDRVWNSRLGLRHALLRWSYRLAPWALLLGAVLLATAPRPIRSLGGWARLAPPKPGLGSARSG